MAYGHMRARGVTMKLFYSPFHTFIHKVLVTAHETGHWDAITFVPTFPFKNNDGEDVAGQYSIAALNPLDKVPTLALDSGQVIYGSQAICEYLDSNSLERRLYPEPGPARWDAITRLALCDTMFELTVQMVMEGWQPEEERRESLYRFIWPKLKRGLDRLEEGASNGWNDFDIGHASALHMLSYTEFRFNFYGDKDPVEPDFDWRKGHPSLQAWYEEALQRPSVQSHYNKDFEGDKSPQFHQAMVREVLEAQQGSDT